jgi:type I restriction enzyme S subunit
MRSNYKVLGQYIQPVVGRNNTLGNLPLVGLSIQKKFIPSIANTIGTDMSTYKIIHCCPVKIQNTNINLLTI